MGVYSCGDMCSHGNIELWEHQAVGYTDVVRYYYSKNSESEAYYSHTAADRPESGTIRLQSQNLLTLVFAYTLNNMNWFSLSSTFKAALI